MKLIIVIIINFVSFWSNCFPQIDTNKIIFNSKLEFINNSLNLVDTNYVYGFVQNYNPKYEIIDSVNGFEKIIFIKIYFESLIDTSLRYTVYEDNYFYRNQYFTTFAKMESIVGFNITNGDMYKLKNFNSNDFNSLYQFLYLERHASRKEIMKNYYVEGLDLKCLVKNRRRRKGGCYDNPKKIDLLTY